ncbi:hypothetical protein G6F16_008800 [Rhizopus arrhizus]|uniref:Spindle assembly checkpoint component MAD1 n=1 Tax=Rhizopus oryzae TaxID=64495 RepID=A0A9P7BQV8_RHIOR|nr:hypothetical protein G6F23_002962 [Rhizopus arrhizus]KAG0761125.1 hypothetical protein G6F24_007799 [Rhizopus arrhizus]KAG0798075.1 hypothetical protein G6F21_000013 [Rhizopus arrhizus]KAG0800065.1 hypothetical protein G6F22_002604 [Rhizopus arrhizus]KAG0812718.1 hypothetical protein G6F20_006135 [Rhizopus arrhizus]
MPDNPTAKRQRVTADLLDYPRFSEVTLTPELKVEKQSKNQELIEKLKHENFILKNKYESLKHVHDLEIQDKGALIKQLMEQKAEAETRAIYHMKKSKESSERLEAVTKETEQMTKGLNVQIQKLQAEVEEFKSLADKRLHEKEALIAEKRFTEEQKDVKINSLSSKVNSLNDMLKERTDTIQKISEKTATLASTVSNLTLQLEDASKYPGDSEDYKKLEEQYLLIYEQHKTLVSENKSMSSQLNYYTEMVKEIEQLNDKNMTIQERLAEMARMHEENTKLSFEVSKFKAERAEWIYYLESQPELLERSPKSIIRELAEKNKEREYLKKENEMLQQTLNDTMKLSHKLESHMDDLKKKALEYKSQYQLALLAKDTIAEDKETLNLHIRLLEDQLKLYDHEEKTYMSTTYDEKKSARILELEGLLKQFQEKIEQQNSEIANVKLNSSPSIIIPNGPYTELSSGMTIFELLSKITKDNKKYHKEFMDKVIEYDMLKKDLEAAIKKFEAMSGTTDEQNKQNTRSKEDEQKESIDKDNINIESTKKYRILQLIENPDFLIRTVRSDNLKRLYEENQAFLNSKLSAVEDDVSYVSVPKVSIVNLQTTIGELQKKIETKEKRIKRLLTYWEKQNERLHETIQFVLGYKITLRDDGIVKIESSFVDRKRLTFFVNMSDDTDEAKLRIVGAHKDYYMDMLLHDAYQTYIEQDKNIPAFLNAAGQELFVQYKQKQDEASVNEQVEGEEGEYREEITVYEQPEESEEGEGVYKDEME